MDAPGVLTLLLVAVAARTCGGLIERLRLPRALGEMAVVAAACLFLLRGPLDPWLRSAVSEQGRFLLPRSDEAILLLLTCAWVAFVFGLGAGPVLRLRGDAFGLWLGVACAALSVALCLPAALAASDRWIAWARAAPACFALAAAGVPASMMFAGLALGRARSVDPPEARAAAVAAHVTVAAAFVAFALAGQGPYHRFLWGSAGAAPGVAPAVLRALAALAALAVALVAQPRLGRLERRAGDRVRFASLAVGGGFALFAVMGALGVPETTCAFVAGVSLSGTRLGRSIAHKMSPLYSFAITGLAAAGGVALAAAATLAPGAMDLVRFAVLWAGGVAASALAACVLLSLAARRSAWSGLRAAPLLMCRFEGALLVVAASLAAGFLQTDAAAAVIAASAALSVCGLVLFRLVERAAARKGRMPAWRSGREAQGFSMPSEALADAFAERMAAEVEARSLAVLRADEREALARLCTDARTVSIARAGRDVRVECAAHAQPLVWAAAQSVSAELRAAAASLQIPAAASPDAGRAEAARAGRAFGFVNYLQAGALEPDLKAGTKEGVIRELVGILHRERLVSDPTEAERAIWERERVMSTGMQFGIAIPHGRTFAVDRLVCAVGLKREGIAFGSLDGQPSRIFVLSLSPMTAAAPHVQFMSMISNVLDDDGRRRLLACRTPAEMLAALSGAREEPAAGHPPGGAAASPPGGGRTGPCRIGDYVRPEFVRMEMRASDKEGAIDELLGMLRDAGRIRNVDAARAAVLRREATMSTGMLNGVAIPHARTDEVDELVCAVGLKHAGLDFGAADGRPSTIVVMTLSPRDRAAPHIQVMAMISRSLNAPGRARILDARSPEEVCAIFRGEEQPDDGRS